MTSDPKGYFVPDGFMGYIPWLNSYMLFATESDYLDFVKEE